MINDILMFLKEEWELIMTYPWSFILFGALLFVAGFTIAWSVHSFFLEKKLHNIPEREALQQEINVLKNQNEELKKLLHRQGVTDLIREVKNAKNTESIGSLIAHKK